MKHFVCSAAVNVRVGKNIKQPAEENTGVIEENTGVIYIYIGSGHYVVVADRRRCHIVRL